MLGVPTYAVEHFKTIVMALLTIMAVLRIETKNFFERGSYRENEKQINNVSQILPHRLFRRL